MADAENASPHAKAHAKHPVQSATRNVLSFFHGKYDYTVSYPLARAYLDTLQAPIKGFYTFENSAHSPMFEEPDRMRQILQEDVLVGMNLLADGM